MEEAYKGATRIMQNNGKQKQVRIPAGVQNRFEGTCGWRGSQRYSISI